MSGDVSLCMIVKNEEDWIEQAVSSVISLVAEVIIVDTGSTDRTLERVRRFDPKIVRSDWTGHFGNARNISLESARCPWILVLDADECIAERDLPVLRTAIERNAHGFHLIQRNYVHHNRVHGWEANTSDYEEGRRYSGFVDNPLIRFFRNDPGLRFHGAVHEIVDPARLPPGFEFPHLSVVIHHYGKVRGEDRVRAKQHMYLDLGRKKIAEEPENGKAYLDYGIQLQELDRHAESREPLLKSFEMTGNPAGLLFCALAEKRLENYAEAEALLDRAARTGLDTFELRLERGNVALADGRFETALERYRKCLEGSVASPVATFNVGLAHKKLGQLDKAVTYYQRAARLDAGFVEPRLALASIYSDRGDAGPARDILEELLELHPRNRQARLALAKSCIQLQLSDRALELLDGWYRDDPLTDSLRGAALAQQGKGAAARKYLESAIRGDASLIDARINLSHVYGAEGDFRRAARHLKRGYEATGNDELLPALAIYEARAEMFDDALPHLERVIEFGRPTAEHWICRTLILERTGRPEELNAHYRAMVQAHPELESWITSRLTGMGLQRTR